MLERRINTVEELNNILIGEFNLNVDYNKCTEIMDTIIRTDHLLELTQDNKILILKSRQTRELYYNENNINDLIDIGKLLDDLNRNNTVGLYSNLVNSYFMIDSNHSAKMIELLHTNNIPYIHENNPGILYANNLLSNYYLNEGIEFNYDSFNKETSNELFRKVDNLVEEQQVLRNLFKQSMEVNNNAK